ncbi:MAG: hypothetical protein NTW11_02570 [Candidatus Staskawiczbacteria bacterium]|nr:hypothetical protein [Candidatus Staskawiczbacteria bacterium]
MNSLLNKSELTNGVEIHTDLLSTVPTALSIKRAQRLGKPHQEPNKDELGVDGCRLCNPEKLAGKPKLDFVAGGKVASFPNAAPFLPYDQKVLFVWHDDVAIRKGKIHITKLGELRKIDFYLLLKGVIECARRFAKNPITSYDIPRMVLGFNFGKLAGQTIPHIHAQYGWDSHVSRETICDRRLGLYYRELAQEQLIIYPQDENNGEVKLIAPWSPRGQYHVDLHFARYEIHKFSERDIKIFAHFAWRIVKHYVETLGIQNINIVFMGSPLQREVVPVVAQFVPRINMPALYEVLGVNVVDTPPSAVAASFRSICWQEEVKIAEAYDPEEDWKNLIS